MFAPSMARKHIFVFDLTFGHGIHACIGRELARSEIRVVLKKFLEQTDNLEITGETPFIASMFARTLLQLPVKFDTRVVDAELDHLAA